MAEYIEREEAAAVFRNARKSLSAKKCDYMANEYLTRDTMLLNAEQIIHVLPAADVAPVRKGRWVWDDEGYYCSECFYHAYGETGEVLSGHWHYCPNCGAKMEVEE